MVAVRKDYAAPTGLGSSPIGWERMAAGQVRVLDFGLWSTNMPRRRRWKMSISTHSRQDAKARGNRVRLSWRLRGLATWRSA